MSVYRWREGFVVSADPAAVGIEIDALRARTSDDLSAARLVEAARASNGALHDVFEWDDAKAAAAQRLDRAGAVLDNLIVTVRFGDAAPPRPPRPVTSAPPRTAPVDRAALEAKMRREEVRRAIAELAEWRRRHGAYEELKVFCAALDVAFRRAPVVR